MDISHIFHGPNSGYVLDLYERYLKDPDSVDSTTRTIFDKMRPEVGDGRQSAAAGHDIQKIVGAVNLAQAIRVFGHLAAKIDPLGSTPTGDPALDTATHGVTEDDLSSLPPGIIDSPIADRAANALEAIQGLRSVYSSTIGFDYYHINSLEERRWLREVAESGSLRPPKDPIN